MEKGIKVVGIKNNQYVCELGKDVMKQLKEQFLWEFRCANYSILDKELIQENIHSDDNFINWIESTMYCGFLNIKKRIVAIDYNEFINFSDFLDYL